MPKRKSPSPLFAKIRSAALANGLTGRTATRKARLLQSASYSQFVRLTPEQNVKAGLSPKARHYALKGSRPTKSTPTISARQFENKKNAELFGLTPEQATEARKHGAISYSSADQRARVAKAARTRVVSRIKKAGGRRQAIPSNSPDKRRHGRIIALRHGDAQRYQDLKRRRMAGEELPIGDWVWMIDVGQHFGDPDVDFMRGSPSSFGFGFAA